MKQKKKAPSPVFRAVVGEALYPLMEGPVPEVFDDDDGNEDSWVNMRCWMKGGKRRPTDPRLLLGVLGCPLAPVAVCTDSIPQLSIKDVPIEASSAQYIVQQYIAATGATKLLSSVHNSYIMGKVKMMVLQYETATRVFKVPMKSADNGWFTLWQMMPDKWHMELSLEGSMVQAGSDGNLVWRHTPWLGAHAAKGPVRPLRRVLQGLDPLTTASIFASARHVGEKRVRGEDCFVLTLSADPSTLTDRSSGPSEVIRHELFGCFSQRTGWLVHLEDNHLTRMQADGHEQAVYWETTIESSLSDYRVVDGVAFVHAGKSVVTLLRFGDDAANTRTRIEETWSIEEVVFNVPGLSQEFFIPPAEITSIKSQEEEDSASVLEKNHACYLSVDDVRDFRPPSP